MTSFEAASKLVTQWHAAGSIGGAAAEPTRIVTAVMKYLDDARARHLAETTITKLTTIFEKQVLKFAKDHGYRFLKERTPDRLTAWRSTWKDEALAASKKYQRVVGFFFCMRMKWISDNPMKSLHPPKVKQDPTLPFTSEEVNAIVSACDHFPINGIYGEGNRKRLVAMVLLLRYSGLRIRDAATLRRERIRDGKLLLYMQKTGVPVFVPLPPYVAAALEETPNVHPSHFRSGNGLPKTTVADWQRSPSEALRPCRSQRRACSSVPRHIRRGAPPCRGSDRPSVRASWSFIRQDHREELCAVGQGAAGTA